MKIGIGNDHTSVDLKFEIMKYLTEKGHVIVNYGTDTIDKVDYPTIGKCVALAVQNKEIDKGIVICGTGFGISLAANKIKGIRCVTCSEPLTAKLATQCNDANMLAFGARVVGNEMAKTIVDAWLDYTYLGGRHQRRMDMITEIEFNQQL